MGKQQTNHRGKRTGLIAGAIGLCFVLLLVGAVIAKYRQQLRSDSAVRAKEFYFTSDFLDGGTHTLAPGSTSVTFTLGNHADDLRISEVDIQYTVTVTKEGDTEKTVATGTLGKDTLNDQEITISDLSAGTYTVKAVGTGGYSQTLTATIVVLAEAAKPYYHIENVPGEYTLLTIWNEGNEAKNVTIKYTGIPDNTNPNMGDWATGGEKKVTVAPHTSMVFRFFGGTVTVADADKKEPA